MLLQTPAAYLEFTTRHYYNKLIKLRTVELKEILSQIGGPEHGPKPDLVDRILDSYKEETKIRKFDIAKLIEKSYGSLTAARLRGEELPEEYNVEPTTETRITKLDSAKLVDKTLQNMTAAGSRGEDHLEEYNVGPTTKKLRCVCGILWNTGETIRCQDPRCGVWQHKTCVVINPEEKIPQSFYCEFCRLSRADPFCLTLSKFLLPAAKFAPAAQTDKVMRRSFYLTEKDLERLTRNKYEVQAWCVLLNDDVPFRIHWPKTVELRVNGAQVKKAVMTSLGTNSRDDGVNILRFTQVGNNVIHMTYRDSRTFCFGVRTVERRTVRQVMDLIPVESEGEKLDDAVARVRRCIGGGGGGGDDVEIVSDCVPVNLRCPLSGSRIKVAGRFKPCVHMGCFDLEVFLEMAMRSKKWQCPICLKNFCLDDVIIDPYFNRVAARLSNLGLDVNEVEVKPDGSWRAKPSDNNGGVSLWYRPDGSDVVGLDLNNMPEEESQTGSTIGDEFEDAEVINLSDSEEEDETTEVARPLKRAREALADCPVSVQTKRQRRDGLLKEWRATASDLNMESKMMMETTDCPKKRAEIQGYVAETQDLLAIVERMMETRECSNSDPTENSSVRPDPKDLDYIE